MFKGYRAMRGKKYVSMPEEERDQFIERVRAHAEFNHGEIISVEVVEEFNGGYSAYVLHYEDL